MAGVTKLVNSGATERDLLWTLLLKIGGANTMIQKCPFKHSTRDLLFTLIAVSGTAEPAAGSITAAMLAPGAVSDIVSTTKKTGLGVSADGVATFDASGRITAITEAAP